MLRLKPGFYRPVPLSESRTAPTRGEGGRIRWNRAPRHRPPRTFVYEKSYRYEGSGWSATMLIQGSGVSASVVWSPSLLEYRHSVDHPMSPHRLDLTMSLATELGVLQGVELTDPGFAADEDILRIHTKRYLDAVKHAGTMTPGEHEGMSHGLGTPDNPVFPAMHEASASIAGGTLAAARAVAHGETTRAVSVAGGMHHAMSSAAAGFCVYNDAAIAIDWLLDNGYSRIAYVDIDVHHGDGVQSAFYEDPRVLTVSLHQHPATLWPSTGWASEIGAGSAEGTAVNLSFLPGVADDLWLRGFHAVVPGALRAFEPEIIVLQCGCDSHREDPLADLALTVDGHRAAYLEMMALADELCGGRIIAIGGGGYELVRVVPRSWTHLIAAVLGTPVELQTAVPASWQSMARDLTVPGRVPTTMGDDDADVEYVPWEPEVPPGDDPAAERARMRVDRSIIDTRRSVFPLLGLDPDDPRD